MKRSAPAKPFVSAGIYNPNAAFMNPENPKTVPKFVQNYPPIPEKIIKSEETPPAFAADTTEHQQSEQTEEQENGKPFFKKIFGIRKRPSVRAKQRKIRQNRRLRKILLPKNALMALHEVKGIQIAEFIVNSNTGGGFTATVVVNNIEYEGSGPSKMAAKNACCEKALRDLIIQRMLMRPAKNAKTEDQDNSETQSENVEDIDLKEEEDEVPMLNLASFALYKLFAEWENEGYEIPEFHNHASTPTNQGDNGDPEAKSDKPKKEPTVRTDLPPSWEIMHPATLLCMMRPGITYVDLGVTGEKPNTEQKIGVVVDGQQFIGTGRSKKLARRDAAVIVCNQLFGTNF